MSRLTDIFTRNRLSGNAVNRPISASVTLSPFKIGSKRFADAYVMMILERIFRGLRNVNYTVSDEVRGEGVQDVQQLADFLTANLLDLVWLYWHRGIVAIAKDRDGRWYMVSPQYWKMGGVNGNEVTNYDIVTYSDAYRFLGKSDLDSLKDHISRLDRLVNADDYLTQSLGAFGILSGKSMGLTPEDKKAFLDGIKRDIGITSDKYQFICMGSEIDFKQVSLPIDELKLSDKVKEEIMAIAGYFGVPYDLIPLSGKSTYDNQKQAIIDFYRNCISPIAESILDLGRYAIKRSDLMLPSRVLTFTLDNIPELEADKDDTDSRLERATKAAELIEKMKSIEGADISLYLDILNNGKN